MPDVEANALAQAAHRGVAAEYGAVKLTEPLLPCDFHELPQEQRAESPPLPAIGNHHGEFRGGF